MTLPIERARSIVFTERFLLDLCQPGKTPRVPKLIRERARSLLRHYPTAYDLKVVEKEWSSKRECPFATEDKFLGNIEK